MSDRDVYLVVAKADAGHGIAGVSCGVTYTSNITMNGWTLCADLEFPSNGWPGNLGGDRISWQAGTHCQTTQIGGDGVHAVAGAFHIFAFGDGTIELTPNNGLVIPQFVVVDCGASETQVQVAGGKVGYGAKTGFNPCKVPVPVQATSWSNIKSYFQE